MLFPLHFPCRSWVPFHLMIHTKIPRYHSLHLLLLTWTAHALRCVHLHAAVWNQLGTGHGTKHGRGTSCKGEPQLLVAPYHASVTLHRYGDQPVPCLASPILVTLTSIAAYLEPMCACFVHGLCAPCCDDSAVQVATMCAESCMCGTTKCDRSPHV